jgi:hypothetical protein
MEPQTFFKHQMKTRKQIRGRARRAEAAWLRKMRAVVFARDGGCRAAGIGWCEGDFLSDQLANGSIRWEAVKAKQESAA